MVAAPDFSSLLALPLLQRIMTEVAQAGGEARVVGGAVRDVLLGHKDAITDIDMATTLTPDVATAALKHKCRVIATGIEHGTITVIDKKQPTPAVELTTLRRDIETDGRHAKVRFGTNWLEDAERRDFTINALYLDAHGTIYDPLGGRADLDAGIVRFVGDARVRIAEDYLRVLRFFRFYGRFGKKAPDADALEAITTLNHGLERISGERITKEMRAILTIDPARPLRAMIETGTDKKIAPSGFSIDRIEDDELGGLLALKAEPMFILGFIIKPDEAAAVASRLKLSRRESRLLALGVTPIDDAKLESQTWQRQAWEISAEIGAGLKVGLGAGLRTKKNLDSIEIAWVYAASALRRYGKFDKAVYARLAQWQQPRLPLRGADIKARGVPDGAEIGRLLKCLEEEWLASDFTANRSILLKKLDALLSKG